MMPCCVSAGATHDNEDGRKLIPNSRGLYTVCYRSEKAVSNDKEVCTELYMLNCLKLIVASSENATSRLFLPSEHYRDSTSFDRVYLSDQLIKKFAYQYLPLVSNVRFIVFYVLGRL